MQGHAGAEAAGGACYEDHFVEEGEGGVGGCGERGVGGGCLGHYWSWDWRLEVEVEVEIEVVGEGESGGFEGTFWYVWIENQYVKKDGRGKERKTCKQF